MKPLDVSRDALRHEITYDPLESPTVQCSTVQYSTCMSPVLRDSSLVRDSASRSYRGPVTEKGIIDYY